MTIRLKPSYMDWTPNELADVLRNWIGNRDQLLAAANKLEYQEQEIADLKIANQDLKYQLIQKSGELILADFDIKELEKEIEHLKSKVQYWKAREK